MNAFAMFMMGAAGGFLCVGAISVNIRMRKGQSFAAAVKNTMRSAGSILRGGGPAEEE
jgi:hypothetical protein